MNSFAWLLRREFWENRGSFWTTYFVVGVIFVIFAIGGWFTGAVLIADIDGDKFFLKTAVSELESVTSDELRAGAQAAMTGLSQIYRMILFFVIFFYLLGALYEDRKDKSILFWKSLPISDAKTVLSKLATAIFLAPLLMISLLAVAHIALSLVGAAMALWAGINPFKYWWLVFEGPKFWFAEYIRYLIYGLWMLPIWGWLIFCSAFAKSKPFLWAIAIPAGTTVLLSWMQVFNLSFDWGKQLAIWFFDRFVNSGIFTFGLQINTDSSDVLSISEGPIGTQIPWDVLARGQTWFGIILGVAFIASAIWIRRYRDENI